MSSALPRTVDDVRDFLASLRDRVNDLEMRFDAFSQWLETTDDRVTDLEEQTERLHQQLEAAEATAEQAMVIASKGHDPDSLSKVEQAKRIARNELLLRTVGQTMPSDRPVTVDEVQDMGRPDVDFAYQTVKDAFNQLQTDHHAFRETTKDGARALSIDRGEITKSLTRLAEADLGRDDLTKTLITDEGEGGA